MEKDKTVILDKIHLSRRKWRHKNRIKVNEYNKKWKEKNLDIYKRWFQNNKEKMHKYRKKWRDKNKEKLKKDVNEWRKENPEKYRITHNKNSRDERERKRMKILIHYGGNPPKCACCGETIIKFLTVDHINNDGAKHRKEIYTKSWGGDITRWLTKNNYPEGFRILCWNCNCGRAHNGGICPHKERTCSDKS